MIAPGLRVLFCGINPGLYSGATGFHFARPGNRFWPALAAAGLTPGRLQPGQSHALLASGLGPSADAHLPILQRLQVALALAATDDLSAYDLHPEAVAQTGARILWLMAAVAAQLDTLDATIAVTLAQAWQPGTAALLNAALILCADHELNASSFTAPKVPRGPGTARACGRRPA